MLAAQPLLQALRHGQADEVLGRPVRLLGRKRLDGPLRDNVEIEVGHAVGKMGQLRVKDGEEVLVGVGQRAQAPIDQPGAELGQIGQLDKDVSVIILQAEVIGRKDWVFGVQPPDVLERELQILVCAPMLCFGIFYGLHRLAQCWLDKDEEHGQSLGRWGGARQHRGGRLVTEMSLFLTAIVQGHGRTGRQ